MIVEPILPIPVVAVIAVVLIVVALISSRTRVIDILLILLLFVANLNLSFLSDESETKTTENNLDVLIVMDNTISMNAEDYQGEETRLSGAKADAEYILQELVGARFAVITFDSDAKIIVPFTRDINLATEAIEATNPTSEWYARGTTLNVALPEIETLLERSAKEEGRQRVMFFISDGEITTDEELESFAGISQYLSGGAVLGYGTKQGGYMHDLGSYSGEDDYIMDTSDMSNYGKAVSKIDEDNLRQIAADAGIEYVWMDKQSNVDAVLTSLEKTLTAESSGEGESRSYQGTYFAITGVMVILLVVKFIMMKRRWR